MGDEKIAKTIGVDELVQSITSATIRAVREQAPDLSIAERGVFVQFRIICGIPPATERALLAAEGAE
jgi:hypothetical protein